MVPCLTIDFVYYKKLSVLKDNFYDRVYIVCVSIAWLTQHNQQTKRSKDRFMKATDIYMLCIRGAYT
ncbi:MAG: hypothetical protein GFH27_549279n146 [Chloroflexi bacterium AL-W]|nr:hypothetical protein [Chloroflexi bacterium AL-N1]NOK65112.1 hypothetical protein [Chloroflexi bacterium AL-N10]NOK72621.1 hypothetical protein [Chloroflexi bacterium AL-N5]NOK79291.1 hypothetical protein [Chloroflexi bacterium AL-W]NOK87207.1 hypothetical protein [Chloroflexi bacterium AL-N15]